MKDLCHDFRECNEETEIEHEVENCPLRMFSLAHGDPNFCRDEIHPWGKLEQRVAILASVLSFLGCLHRGI